ncbi:unnamed protein product [Merluccius merluccius]
MSLADSPRSSLFTYESRTHCLNVLGRLDEQRCRDLLCDVTVAVDGQSFRAHRSVLSACSKYFANAISKDARHGAVLSLPQEVTAAGFEPLLKFAYTSKLLFSKHDVLEVRNAASILGFKDLDKACFDFLLPKFFNSSRSSALCPRNICCKNKCKRRLAKEDNGLTNDISENEAKLVSDSSSDQEVGWLDNQSGMGKTGIKKSPTPPTSGMDKQPKETNDYFLQCPKYRKFQLACCTDKTLDLPTGATLPLPGHSHRGCEDQSDSVVENPGKTDAVHPFGSVKATAEEQFHAESQESTKSHRNDKQGVDDYVKAKGNPSNSETREMQARDGGREGRPPLRLPDTASHCPGIGSSSLNWPRLLAQHSVGATLCPFLQDPGPAVSECKVAEGAELCESEGMCTSQKCPPCVSPLNSTEEVDSETETEGDDSCALEKARQVQLPFSVDWVVDLSKNDFQRLLKKQTLNVEQLEFVHDMRRRSKNRMAAQRCRKRKLECIYNLECEINKLRTEKQRMLAEQERLCQLKMNSWHTVSALCHKICSEASLLPEQLQVLAKYTATDCPLASLIPHIDTTLSVPVPPPQAQASLSAPASHLDVHSEAYPWRSSNPSGEEQSSPDTVSPH